MTELRKRLVYSIVILLLGFFACWGFSEQILILFEFLLSPSSLRKVSFHGTYGQFLAHIKVCLLASLVVSSPLWVYQVWAFIAPGLYKDERKFGALFISMGSSLFVAGVSFVYYVVYPLAFKFLLTFGGDVDKPMITIKEYLSFFITTTLVFGAAFEMPWLLQFWQNGINQLRFF